MGLFSGISNAIKSVTSPIKSLWSDSGIGDVLDIGSTALGAYNDITGNSAKVQKELMAYQAQLQNESWKYQMSNRHQLEVGDLRNAGLNPILSANSAGAIAAGIPNGSLADSDSSRYQARTSAQLARQQAQAINSQIATNGSQIYRNNAEADAVARQADYAGMRTQADVALSLAHADLMRAQAQNARDPLIKYSGAMSTGGALLGAGMGALTRFGIGKMSSNTARYLGTRSRSVFDGDGVLIRHYRYGHGVD